MIQIQSFIFPNLYFCSIQDFIVSHPIKILWFAGMNTGNTSTGIAVPAVKSQTEHISGSKDSNMKGFSYLPTE